MKNQKIKVAFFAEILQSDFDGASRTMAQIVKRIPKTDYEFIFICGVGPKEDIGFEVIEIPTMNIPFNSTYKMALPFLSINLINQKLKEFQPDIIHVATPSPLGHFGLEFAKKNDKPVVTIYHTHFLSYIDYYLRNIPLIIPTVKKIIGSNQKNFYDRCDTVFVPTNNMVKELSKYSFDISHMKLWQRGIDKSLFHPINRDVAILRAITKNDRPNILYASRLVWEKNLQTLVATYKRAESLGLQYNFIIAGDGVAQESLKEQMPNAFFLGKLEHTKLAKVYASSDIFLFPSISETYGNVVIEAMASGLPCVIGDGGGTADHIDHGFNGYKCEPNNPDAYISHIEDILNSNQIKEKLIRGGLDYIQDLSWDALVDRYFLELEILTTNEYALTA